MRWQMSIATDFRQIELKLEPKTLTKQCRGSREGVENFDKIRQSIHRSRPPPTHAWAVHSTRWQFDSYIAAVLNVVYLSRNCGASGNIRSKERQGRTRGHACFQNWFVVLPYTYDDLCLNLLHLFLSLSLSFVSLLYLTAFHWNDDVGAVLLYSSVS
jgi:hypothetical protein